MSLLDPEDLATLLPAETAALASPIPTQFVSSDEFTPLPQTARQKLVERRVVELGDALAKHQGMSRRRFFQTAAGMAAAFVAMNDVYGPIFGASRAEAATPELANERAKGLADQFIMDMHTHFLRDDTRLEGFVRSREAVGKSGWNPALAGKPQTLEDLKFANYFKEVFFDSDTKVALISGSGSEEPRDWFLTNEMKAEARAKVNRLAGSRRMFSHAIFMPGMPGWMDDVDRAIDQLKPDSFKGYTVGDNTNKQLARHPWRMDDEKLLYPFYEKLVKAGLVNVCVHKGLYPMSTTQRFPASSPMPTCATWARRPRTGRSSTSSSTIPPSGSSAASGPRAGRNSSRRGAWTGSPTSRRFPPSTASPTSTATSARSSPRARWPSRACARP